MKRGKREEEEEEEGRENPLWHCTGELITMQGSLRQRECR